jgi:hypothetical protein
MWFSWAHARIGQVLPNNRCWAISFFSASALVPDPQLEQVSNRFNLQTSQLIPQAPVGMASPRNNFEFVFYPITLSLSQLSSKTHWELFVHRYWLIVLEELIRSCIHLYSNCKIEGSSDSNNE